ncbi:membrane protein [Lysinibacillus odysseyi 34hs-1 = NBRC 100172]|uniref:Membrane protein n=1 Tax=Lysinibacillus odysseyi 34hs-1 = NBRC 100172 TaxID=1220589 RepID=A0A0A3INJ1_9BACI|nr:membrane protein [Lysinibacillus odysseyi 34hs-1 = NBRC 100172]
MQAIGGIIVSQTLIQADDTITLWGILIVWASVSIYLEQRYSWASKISGAIIALIGAIFLSNTGIIPTESPVYDSVWGVIVPLAIPLLLFHVNIKKIWKESGKLLLIFLLSSVGTVAGTIISFFLLKDHIPYLDKIGAMMSASYIGGGVNFAAMAAKFEAPGELVSATVVADNLMMAIYFIILMIIPTLAFFRKRYSIPHVLEVESGSNNESGKTLAESFWKRKDISLKDIALSVGTAFLLVIISFKIAGFFDTLVPSGEDASILFNLLNGLVGDKYLVLTTMTFIVLGLFPRYFDNINGSQEIGTYLIYIFFVVIGIPASIPLIIKNAPLLLLFVFIIVLINMIVSLLAGKLLKANLEDILLASNANIGGPTTAAALAIAKGWKDLIGPILVVGTIGYIIGNYVGTLLGFWFSTMV